MGHKSMDTSLVSLTYSQLYCLGFSHERFVVTNELAYSGDGALDTHSCSSLPASDCSGMMPAVVKG